MAAADQEPVMIGRGERIAFGLLVLITWTYVILRATMVPLVHDEARTFFVYNAVGSFQPWCSYWDAANHLLNTALGQVGYLLFGPSALALRLFNVLSFLLYGCYVWRLGGLVRTPLVRWCLWAALVCVPFGIEFFGLYRGYGLGMAFWAMALFHLFRFAAVGRYIHLLGTLVGTMLAAYASLTLLVLWCVVLAHVGFLFLRMRVPVKEQLRRWGTWTVLGPLPLIYLAAYALALSERGLFYYGSEKGLIEGTLRSLCLSLFASDAVWLLGLIIVLACWPIVQALVLCVRDPRRIGRTPLVILAHLLVAEVTARLLLGHLFGIPYPIDRTALYLVVLVVLLVAFALDTAAARVSWMRWAALGLLLLPWNLTRRMDLVRTTWSDQAISEDIHLLVEARQRAAARPLAVGAASFLCDPWALSNLVEHPSLAPAQEIREGGDAPELLLIPTRDLGRYPGHHVLLEAASGDVVLCERNVPWNMTLLLDTMIGPVTDPTEFTMLWLPQRPKDRGTALLVEVEAVITCPLPLEAWIVCSERDTTGKDHAYVPLDLLRARTSWQADTLSAVRWLPLAGGAGSLPSVSLWDKEKRSFRLHQCRVRIHRLDDRAAVVP